MENKYDSMHGFKFSNESYFFTNMVLQAHGKKERWQLKDCL